MLPIRFYGAQHSEPILSCPDSGSDENVISLAFARKMNLQLSLQGTSPKQFLLANGKTIEALGHTSALCSFGREHGSCKQEDFCNFYVMEKLAIDAIMGNRFLQETETLTKHQHRLQITEDRSARDQPLRINAMNPPEHSLLCRLDTFVACATADTGADLNFVSSHFVQQRTFKIRYAREKVQFADGSTAFTSGRVSTTFTPGVFRMEQFEPTHEGVRLEFFLLDGLTSDIVIGVRTISRLRVFDRHQASFMQRVRSGMSDLNIIKHISTINKLLNGRSLSKKQDRAFQGSITSKSNHHHDDDVC